MKRALKRRHRSSTESQDLENRAQAEKRHRPQDTEQTMGSVQVKSPSKLFGIIKIDSEPECGPSLANLYNAQDDVLVQEIYDSNVAEEVIVTSECECVSCSLNHSELSGVLSPHSRRSSEVDPRLLASENEIFDRSYSSCKEIPVKDGSSPVIKSILDSDDEHSDELEGEAQRDDEHIDLACTEYALESSNFKTSRAVTFLGQLTPGSSIGPGSSRKCHEQLDSPARPYASQSRCPVPQLSWADREQFWEVMCRKDEDSLKNRNPELFTYQQQLKPRMRIILLEWISEVTSVFGLHRETYYLTVDYIDRYLSCVPNIPKQQLQLIGVTCLFMASKMEEIHPPKIEELANVTDAACTAEEIFQMEVTILRHLNWLLSPMTINNWLETLLQFIFQKTKDDNLFTPWFSSALFKTLCQLLDLATLDITSLRFSYCVLATTAIYILVDPDLAMSTSGLKKEVLDPCVQWMSVYWKVIRERSPSETDRVADSLNENNEVYFGNQHPEKQEHFISLELYERVQAEFELMEAHKELETKGSQFLTPP